MRCSEGKRIEDPSSLLRRVRVLIVEDSIEEMELLVRNLIEGGCKFSFEQVETAKALKGALAREPWDIIIANCGTGGFGGLEALKVAREIRQDLPFIMISATPGEEAAVEAMPAGVNDYVMKCNLDGLARAVYREIAEAEVRKGRRYSEQKISSSEQRYRAIFEGPPEDILIGDDEEKSPEETTGTKKRETALGLNILLVDDDDQVRAIIRETLAANGHLCFSAANAEEALEIMRRQGKGIDLLLTDLVMPGMNGRQLAEKILALWPGIKILFMSGYPDQASFERKALNEGEAFLKKPFGSKELIRKIEAVMA